MTDYVAQHSDSGCAAGDCCEQYRNRSILKWIEVQPLCRISASIGLSRHTDDVGLADWSRSLLNGSKATNLFTAVMP